MQGMRVIALGLLCLFVVSDLPIARAVKLEGPQCDANSPTLQAFQ